MASTLRLKLETPLMVLMYRLLGGFGDGPKILLLTTTGRKSQRKRTVPAVYMRDGEHYVLTAANLGSDAHPGWFLNLQHNPQAHIQIGRTELAVVAGEASPEQRERLWAKWIETKPGYVAFQAKTARKFPMIILKPS